MFRGNLQLPPSSKTSVGTFFFDRTEQINAIIVKQALKTNYLTNLPGRINKLYETKSGSLTSLKDETRNEKINDVSGIFRSRFLIRHTNKALFLLRS